MMMFKKSRICLAVAASCILLAHKSYAVTFDTSLLAGGSKDADLSRFYRDSDIPPGQQELDIYVNHNWKGRYTVVFSAKGKPSISRKDAALLGIVLKAPMDKGAPQSITLEELVQGGNVEVSTATLSVNLAVPQAYLDRSEVGYVAPQFWDEGIPALLLSYNMTYYNTQAKGQSKDTSDDLYTGVDSGLNLYGFQLRDSSTWRKRSGEDGQWVNNTRYVRKPIAALKANLTAGDMYTPGDLFDSVRMRGVSLMSDMQMLPGSQQGFAPVVRGIARTNALVKVIQNGNTVYQENVPPGQFVLDSIQPTGSAGDLQVIVHEADGNDESFTVPFSAVPGMLKEGIAQYSIVAGKVKQIAINEEPDFLQGTLRYGFNNLVTGYAGTIVSDNYRAGLLGAGWNLPVGAVSVDVTHASSTLVHGHASGQSIRIAWSKFVDATATNFTLAAYRYSTKGYYSFSDLLYSREGYNQLSQSYEDLQDKYGPGLANDFNARDAFNGERPKNTFTINLNQRLQEGWGTVFVSGTQRDYWSSGRTMQEYQLGYSGNIGRTSFTVSASRVRNTDMKEETRLYTSFSIPFTIFDNSAWLTASASGSDSSYEQSNLSLSGTALSSNRLSYTLSGSNQRGGTNMASANAAYRANFATLGASWSESSEYRQQGLSGRGSLVAIPGHLLAANEIGTTMTVVDAPKAAGLMVNGDESIVTNRDGLALVPYATPYRKNSVTLSETEHSSGAEVTGNVGNSVPYDGAVNCLHFPTDLRQSWQLYAVDAEGKPLPFGAEVTNGEGESVGYVGQASILFIRSEKQPEQLNVRLRDRTCLLNHPTLGLNNQPGICR